ncbi:MAG TPA: OmcA/MtrC family decaheme c-type cytochrome [Bryobacteraceae bacterium]|nr:OmcA/MtrC family decaheme c-type cytochrome [Bryobacteraceae bacterium]
MVLVLLLLTGSVTLTGSSKTPYSHRDKAFWADRALVAFVHPGLTITINSAQISSSGAISMTYTITDPNGLPLDAAGTTTPGAVSLAYVAAYIPKGQQQYTALTTGSATGTALGTITRPDFEFGAPPKQVGPGQYTYTFQAKAPAGFDPTLTYTVATDGSRDLTAFNLGTNYAGATFNFVPNGSAVTVTRDVIRTASCNRCHDQLAFHGGYAHGMEMCVLCHQPQNLDPGTGNTLDLKVMAHKIHMGSQLPSVNGYTSGTTTVPPAPYQILGYMNSVNDFSTVVDPANPQRCEVCHDQTTGAAQATAFMTTPTRAACGACHDDVNFATGANHPGGFQMDDNECANCHIAKGETPFDASILGAHVVANDTPAAYPANPNTLISSVVVTITGVTNGVAGKAPTVAYTVKDINGHVLALSALEDLQFTMAGPTTDYGYTSFGSDVTTPGYVGEDGTLGTCDTSGNCTYTFQHAIPAGATGTYAIGVESEILENILPNTNAAQQVESGTPNQVFYFSVDGSTVAARRTVVAETNCNQCHVNLTLHGNRRNNPQYCVMCHNPSDTDFSQRPAGQTAQTINMAVMVHRIHDGVNVVASGGKPFQIAGFGGRAHDFSGVLYPAMSPSGQATYTQNCQMCHTQVNGTNTEENLPIGLNPVVDPMGWYTPIQATASACSGCHVSKAEAAHFRENTDATLGESCSVCHSSGAQFDVDAMHAQ